LLVLTARQPRLCLYANRGALSARQPRRRSIATAGRGDAHSAAAFVWFVVAVPLPLCSGRFLPPLLFISSSVDRGRAGRLGQGVATATDYHRRRSRRQRHRPARRLPALLLLFPACAAARSVGWAGLFWSVRVVFGLLVHFRHSVGTLGHSQGTGQIDCRVGRENSVLRASGRAHAPVIVCRDSHRVLGPV
jgi:hypothetical protein